MITCPECGAGHEDGAKFCDRCGQGLSAAQAGHAAPALQPLPAGTELKGGLHIIELLSQSSGENRYRAERLHPSGEGDYVILRERRSDELLHDGLIAGGNQLVSEPPAENPAGPSAKTADLKLKPSVTNAPSSAEGTLIESQAEPRHEASTPSPDALPYPLAHNGAAPPAKAKRSFWIKAAPGRLAPSHRWSRLLTRPPRPVPIARLNGVRRGWPVRRDQPA